VPAASRLTVIVLANASPATVSTPVMEEKLAVIAIDGPSGRLRARSSLRPLREKMPLRPADATQKWLGRYGRYNYLPLSMECGPDEAVDAASGGKPTISSAALLLADGLEDDELQAVIADALALD
jgi:hypothetical protein